MYLGIKLWLSNPGNQEISFSVTKTSQRSLFRSAFIVTALHPKSIAFFVAFLPQFIDPARAQLPQLGLMTLTGLVVDIIVMVGYASLATAIAQWMKSPQHQRHLNHVFGGMFILAAGLLASFQR